MVSLVACHACTRSPTLKSVFVYSHASRETEVNMTNISQFRYTITQRHCRLLETSIHCSFRQSGFLCLPLRQNYWFWTLYFSIKLPYLPEYFCKFSCGNVHTMNDKLWHLLTAKNFLCLWILNVGLFINDSWFVRLTISSPHRVTLHSLWRHSILGLLHRHIPF